MTEQSPTPIGGNITAILLREKQLLSNIQQPTSATQQYTTQNPAAFVAGIPVNTRKQESYTYKAEATHHAVESGVLLTDHIILQPIIVDVSFEISNWDVDRPKHALDLLEALWQSRTPIDLLTEHKQLADMVLTSLEVDNSMPEWGKIACSATFEQLKYVTLETVAFPPAKVAPTAKTSGPDASKSAETKTKSGQQQPKEVSLFKKLFS